MFSPYFQYQNQYQNPYSIYNQQPIQSKGLSGKIVNDFNEVMASDIPMDGSMSVFVKPGSEIQTRSWRNDGTVQITRYEPIRATEQINLNTLSSNELGERFGANFEVTDLYDRLDRIENLIKENKNANEHKSNGTSSYVPKPSSNSTTDAKEQSGTK